MSWIDNRIFGQGEQAAADTFTQFVEIAARQVGSSDTSLEEGVSAEKAFVLFTIEGHASGRMSGSGDGFQTGVPETELVAVIDGIAQGNRFFIQLEAEHPGHFTGSGNPEFILM